MNRKPPKSTTLPSNPQKTERASGGDVSLPRRGGFLVCFSFIGSSGTEAAPRLCWSVVAKKKKKKVKVEFDCFHALQSSFLLTLFFLQTGLKSSEKLSALNPSRGRASHSVQSESRDDGWMDGLSWRWTDQIITPWKAPPHCRRPRCRFECPLSVPEPERTEARLRTQTQLSDSWSFDLAVGVTCTLCAHAHHSLRWWPALPRSRAAPPPGRSVLCTRRLTSEQPAAP